MAARVLLPLMRRLTHPQCALRLTKEESCLAVSAIAKLGLSSRDVLSVNWQLFRGRLLHCIPHCDGMELGMIGSASITHCGRRPAAVPLADGVVLDALTSRSLALGAALTVDDLCYVCAVVTEAVLDDGASYDSAGVSTLLISAVNRIVAESDAHTVAQLLRALGAAHYLPEALDVSKVGKMIGWLAPHIGTLDNQGLLDVLSFSKSKHTAIAGPAVSEHFEGICEAAEERLAKNIQTLSVDQACEALQALAGSLGATKLGELLAKNSMVFCQNQSSPAHVIELWMLLLENRCVPNDVVAQSVAAMWAASPGALNTVETLQFVAFVNAHSITVPSWAIEAVRHAFAGSSIYDVPWIVALPRQAAQAKAALSIAGLADAAALIQDLENLSVSDAMAQIKELGDGTVGDELALRKSNALVTRLLWHDHERSTASAVGEIASFVTDTALARRVGCCVARAGPLPISVVVSTLAMLERCLVRDHELSRLIVQQVLSGSTDALNARDASQLLGVFQSLPTSLVPEGIIKMLRQRLDSGSSLEHTALPNVLLGMAERGEEITEEMIVKLAGAATSWNGNDLATVISALLMAKRDISAFIPMLRNVIEHLSLTSVALLFSAMSRNAKLRSALLEPLCDHAEKLFPHAADITAAAIAIAPLNATTQVRRLLPLIADCLAASIHTMSIENICLALGALETMRPSPKNIVRTASMYFLSKANDLSASQLCKVIDVCGRFEPLYMPLFHAILKRLPNDITNGCWDTKSCAEFLAACHRVDLPDFTPFVHRIVAKSTVNAEQIEPSLLPLLIHAMPAAEFSTSAKGLLDRAGAVLPELGCDDIACLSDALLRLTASHHDSVDTLSSSIFSRVAALVKDGVPVPLADLIPIFQLVAQLSSSARLPPSRECTDVFEWAAELVGTATGSELGFIIQAMVRLESKHEACATAILNRLPQVIDLLDSVQISDIVFSLARLGVKAHDAITTIADHCVDHSDKFNIGRDIVRLLHGFGAIGHRNRSVFNVLGARLSRRPITYYMRKEDISLAFSAFGDARYLDEALFSSLGKKAIALATEFGAVDVALTMHCYSQLYLLNADLYNSMASRATEIAEEFSPAGAMMVLNAFGKMNAQKHDMTDRLLDHMIPRLSELNASDVSAMLTSLCQMEYNNAQHWGAIADYLSTNVHQLSAQGLHDLCLVMQTLTWRDDKLLASVGDHAVRLQVTGAMTGAAARVILDTLGVFLHYHEGARQQLSESARSVSRDTLSLETGDTRSSSATAISR